MHKRIVATLVTIVFFLGLLPLQAISDVITKNLPTVEAASYIVCDGDNGEVLFGESYDSSAPMGYLTQMMTAILTIENGGLEKKVTVPELPEDASEGNRVYLRPGEELSVEDLLKAMIIFNATDAAYTLSNYVGTSEAKFVDQMNAKAKELGMANTTFKKSYIPAEDQTTTAEDMAKLAIYVAQNKTYSDIAKSSSLEWTSDAITNEVMENVNQIGEALPEGVGLKKGQSSGENLNFAASAVLDERQIVGVILSAPDGQKVVDDMISVLQLGADGTDAIQILKAGDPITTLSFSDKKNVRVAPKKSFSMTLPVTSSTLVEYKVQLTHVNLPIAADQEVGKAIIYLSGKQVGEVPLVALEGAKKSPSLWTIIATILAVLYIGSILYRLIQNNRRGGGMRKSNDSRSLRKGIAGNNTLRRKLFSNQQQALPEPAAKRKNPSLGSESGRKGLESRMAQRKQPPRRPPMDRR